MIDDNIISSSPWKRGWHLPMVGHVSRGD